MPRHTRLVLVTIRSQRQPVTHLRGSGRNRLRLGLSRHRRRRSRAVVLRWAGSDNVATLGRDTDPGQH